MSVSVMGGPVNNMFVFCWYLIAFGNFILKRIVNPFTLILNCIFEKINLTARGIRAPRCYASNRRQRSREGLGARKIFSIVLWRKLKATVSIEP